jgi:flavin reductase (NADH)
MPVSADVFREALSRWASGVTVVACRHDRRIVATTVSAFTSLSLEPPLILVAAGPNATVLPFLQPGAGFGVSVLAGHQRRLAAVFADPFPVGPSPFAEGDGPVISDALLGLVCTVREVRNAGDHALVVAQVDDVPVVGTAPPLIRFRRGYHVLED